MGCRVSDFEIADELTETRNGHAIRYARARTKSRILTGYCYWIDDKFQGFVGSLEGVRFWADEYIKEHGKR